MIRRVARFAPAVIIFTKRIGDDSLEGANAYRNLIDIFREASLTACLHAGVDEGQLASRRLVVADKGTEGIVLPAETSIPVTEDHEVDAL